MFSYKQPHDYQCGYSEEPHSLRCLAFMQKNCFCKQTTPNKIVDASTENHEQAIQEMEGGVCLA